ncbi:MAG: radical SAM protein [Candidatus Thalassarchaeaceae archaeon]|nr:radical SAM protein [Candidatus Thalassarchaeaceae archaeon]
MIELPQIPNLAEPPDLADTEGCIQCQMGSKLVLFITGSCHWRCDYCPLSESRRDIDWMYANERRCDSFEDVIDEARTMRATGAGITGGDPLMARERTLEGISRLKEEFGTDFHLHMYTSIAFRPEWAIEFADAGLDEIRFHLLDLDASKYQNVIAACSEAGMLTGVEVPCEPDKGPELLELLETLREFKISFLNLNELEITVGNHDNMELRGFNLSTEITAGAAGSAELAVLMRERVTAAELGVPDPTDGGQREPYGFHLKFCTAVFKDAGQLRRRFLRRGEAVIAPHEVLTEDGTLMFGAIEASEESKEDWMRELVSVTGLPPRFLLWDSENSRIEMPLVVAESIASEVDALVSMVEVLPTHDRPEVTMVLLNGMKG